MCPVLSNYQENEVYRRIIGGSPIFASDFVFRKNPIWNDDIEAVYKVLLWLILPDAIFFYCFCEPLLNEKLNEVRSKIQENNLIREYLERKHDEKDLKDILPHIEIRPIAKDLSDWLRSKFKIEEDIEMMKDYTKFSAFDMEDIG